MAEKFTSIDAYIAGFPELVQQVLQQVRKIVREAAPTATETIKYDMPTFMLNDDNLVHFAGYKHHIGFYPAPSGNPEFEEALAGYKTGRGSVQFPLSAPMPVALITRLVLWRAEGLRSKK